MVREEIELEINSWTINVMIALQITIETFEVSTVS